MWVPVNGTSAQSTYIVTLTSPDASSFPNLTAFLDVHDPVGAFVHGLIMQDVSIQENGVLLPVNGLLEKKPGVQFVLAVTPGSSFTIRDASGTSRYEYLLQGLLAGSWGGPASIGDDFSLLTLGGPQLTHSTDAAAMRSSLESYKPAETDTSPSLEALASALQVVSDPTPRPGMERAILFITPPQGVDASLGLQSIITSANQQNIHVFVWLVAPQESFELPEIDQLRNLADQTHAGFFTFSHDEPVPDLETLLEPLRYVYQIGYESKLATTGPQQISAVVTIGGEQFASQPQQFELNLQPPALEILDPPTEIVREFASSPTPETNGMTGELLPVQAQLKIEVTFPDGHVRPLARTSLYVDGALAAENTSPPFDQFSWDLRSYTQEGTHSVRVEAEDQLGWVGQTGEIAVTISVPSVTQEVGAVVSQKRLLVIGLTVLISASILVLVLILGGRIHPRPYPSQVRVPSGTTEKAPQFGYRERLRRLRDPVTQPVRIGAALPARTKSVLISWIDRLPWLRPKGAPVQVLAYLIPLVGSDEPTLHSPLQISSSEVTLGSDSQKASLVISDSSIEGLHARIRHEGKEFQVFDAGTVAGTWVNYEQVSPEGKNLDHADIIHLGRVGFRFKMAQSGIKHRVLVTPLEPEQ